MANKKFTIFMISMIIIISAVLIYLGVRSNNNEIIQVEDSYTCTVGEYKDINITILGGDKPTFGDAIIADTTIATLGEPDEQLKCANCRIVRVNCASIGTTKLIVRSTQGTEKEVTINVVKEEERIEMNDKFTCNVGEHIDTLVKVKGGKPSVYGGSSIANTDIASLGEPELQVDCIDCQMIRIMCNNPGETTITAKSMGGASKTSKISVK